MDKIIALIASLDTKLKETEFASSIIRECNCTPYIIDISTRTVLKDKSDISPIEILSRYGMDWSSLKKLNKAQCIGAMSEAIVKIVPQLYKEGKFDGVLSIGGGQNAKMAASAMKVLPFGVPKLVVSSLACGKRTMEQYVGDKDIMVMHSVADISGLNFITNTVISNACHAMVGMVNDLKIYNRPENKKTIAATMLGITTKGVEGALKTISDQGFETICFHANGVGGRCMESLIADDCFDMVLDMTLHEITCEILGGYCTGAKNRLMTAIENEVPMVVVPGAVDMLDFFIDEDGNGLPENIKERKSVFHNSSIAHTKIFKNEAVKIAEIIAERLNKAVMPITLVLPLKGFCEASAPNGPMYDAEVDDAFIKTIKSCLNKNVKVIQVDANINDKVFSDSVAKEILSLYEKINNV